MAQPSKPSAPKSTPAAKPAEAAKPAAAQAKPQPVGPAIDAKPAAAAKPATAPAAKPAPAAEAKPAPAAKTATGTPKANPAISPIERARMISEAAYFIAESRGFAPGHEFSDWLAAETEVNRVSGLIEPAPRWDE